MQKSFLLLICCILTAGSLMSQTSQQISPVWEVSNGNHLYTNRNELNISVRDLDNNVIVAGSIERDSSFADILIEKFSPTGTLLWKTVYSSGLGKDYDTPSKIIITETFDIYLFCYAELYNGGIGYILKVNKNGQIQWVRDMITETIPHETTIYFDGFVDTSSNLRVTCTCVSYIASTLYPAPTYFMTIAPDGTVSKKFQVLGVSSFADANAYGLNVYHDKTGKFVFVMRDNLVYDQYYLRHIDPETQTDVSIPVSVQQLTPQEKIRFHYIDWSFIKLNTSNGDLYTATNFAISNPTGSFYVLRMHPDGVVQYVFESKEVAPLTNFQDFILLDSTVYITGLISNNGQDDTYIWKISGQGQAVKTTTLNQNGSLIPQHLYASTGGKFYLQSINKPGQNAYVHGLNNSLDVLWKHELSLPAGYDFSGVGAILINSTDLVACGTLRAQKYGNPDYYKNESQFLERFTPNVNGFKWQYLNKDEGTSYVYSMRHTVDPNGQAVVVTQEKTAPGNALPGNIVPESYTWFVYRYDSDGHLLWSRHVPQQILINYFFNIASFDHHGNVYLPWVANINNYGLIKISHDGSSMDSIILQGGFNSIFISNDDHIWCAADIGNGHAQITVVDTSFASVQTYQIQGISNQFFQLPGSSDVYTYSINNDSTFWQLPARCNLYKNGILAWSFALPTQMFDTEKIGESDHDPLSGRLYLSAYSGSYGSSRLFSLTLDGTTVSHTPFGNQYGARIHCQRNGNFFLETADTLSLYDAGFNLIRQDTLPTTGGHNCVTTTDFLYVFEAGGVRIFDNNGHYKAKLLSSSITGGFQQAIPGLPGQLYTYNTIGQGLYISNPIGLNLLWTRGVLKKFDFGTLVSVNNPNEISPEHLTGFPNPVSDVLYVSIPEHLQQTTAQINLFDLRGNLVRSMGSSLLPAVIGIDCHELVAETYFLQLNSGQTTADLKFIKH
jgi:hypothetical protein